MGARLINIEVGTGHATRNVSAFCRDGEAPGLFFCGGFMSSMEGSKANMLDQLGAKTGQSVTRFDYSGTGHSGDDFTAGTISRWLEDAVAIFDRCTSGEQIVIGSSMGGWLALLMNKLLRKQGDNRIKALVLIAPAVDMTKDLMADSFSDAENAEMHQNGRIEQPSAYSDSPYILTKNLIEDGTKHLLFGQTIETGCPVHVIQGVKDRDVPVAHALKLVSHLLLDEVNVTLVPNGDHSLSRPQDLDRLETILATYG